MEAVGAYIRTLRLQQKLTQTKLAELVGVSNNTIWRIEAGQQEPGGSQLAAILTIIRGRIDHVYELLSNTFATKADGEKKAKQQLTAESVLALADTDPKRIALLKRIMILADDPKLRQRILDYLDGLESGRS